MNHGNKYRSDTFRIFGLALMSPLGKSFLDLGEMIRVGFQIGSLIMLVLSLGLFFLGLSMIVKGYIVADKEILEDD